jgi:glucose/mannose transport system substrate-binding protein
MKKVIPVMLILALFAGVAAFGQAKEVEVLHWWTSGGEAAALNVLKDNLVKQGIKWTDSPIAGGGGTQAMVVLRARATAGNPPSAVQMLGFDIIDWAKLGVLANLNDMAVKNNWDAVVPDAIKKFSKFNDSWIAAPVNVHSTNWVWANKKLLDSLKIAIPTTWDQYIAALDKVKASGKVALAHGGQAWQDATIFEGVMLSTGGPAFYKKAFIDLDPEALGSDTMLKSFQRFDQLRQYLDPNFSGRDWNLASAMVIKGDAAFQMMGDWAKGEFLNAKQVPGVDFVAFRTPGTVLFNSDQFVFFKVDASKRDAQHKLAAAVLEPSFQIAFNLKKGSVPSRTDIADTQFELVGKKAMKDLAEANRAGTLMGSMAHGHAAPAAVKNATYDVITAVFNGQMTPEDAVPALVSAVADAQK